MSRLYKSSRFYRPLSVYVNNNIYEICSFIFYNEDGIIFKHDYGYLDNDMEVDFDFEIKRKVKESFNSKIAYIKKSSTKRDGGYDLYIHSELVGLKSPKYQRESSMIFARYETDIEGFTFKKYVKSIDNNLNLVKRDIREEGKKLDHYGLNSEVVKDCIVKLQELLVLLEKEEDNFNKYTVEDYLNEIENN